MDKQAQSNKDWIARQEGRIPSKGAQAAQRASAGLGATDHDAELLEGAVRHTGRAEARSEALCEHQGLAAAPLIIGPQSASTVV